MQFWVGEICLLKLSTLISWYLSWISGFPTQNLTDSSLVNESSRYTWQMFAEWRFSESIAEQPNPIGWDACMVYLL